MHAWHSLIRKSVLNAVLASKCSMHFTECPDLKPLTGRSRSTRRKAGDSSPERQESIHDTEASEKAGSKKRESCAHVCFKIRTNIHAWCSLKCCTSKCNLYVTECLGLKPLTGRSCSMLRKAGDSSPVRQESMYDREASKRAGSEKRESFALFYY